MEQRSQLKQEVFLTDSLEWMGFFQRRRVHFSHCSQWVNVVHSRCDDPLLHAWLYSTRQPQQHQAELLKNLHLLAEGFGHSGYPCHLD